MHLLERIELVVELGKYLQANKIEWQKVKNKTFEKNPWFTEEFIQLACKNICNQYLQKDKLLKWINHYHLDDNIQQKNVGVVMAGNIPMVGFHDFLCIFISGHKQTIKLSSKDDVLLKHLVEKLYDWQPSSALFISFAEMLKGCDAYIATGSNNSARYFDYYFGKYPSVIRRNRTSVAVLTGNEDSEALTFLADDVHQYFGLGCRNVTKIFVPREYDFVPLLTAFKKYAHFADHPKYKNNYDYYLALQIMNKLFYMTNNSIILVENNDPFSPISQLHYTYYTDPEILQQQLEEDTNIQCHVGLNGIEFGTSQMPTLFNYADGVDTMQFLLSL
ncbi:MAG: acyl-CoA reductase [Chitinophagaceae bacterium]|nr:acyl-CoA reductase [Chitinophagaceae bacterium]